MCHLQEDSLPHFCEQQTDSERHYVHLGLTASYGGVARTRHMAATLAVPLVVVLVVARPAPALVPVLSAVCSGSISHHFHSFFSSFFSTCFTSVCYGVLFT